MTQKSVIVSLDGERRFNVLNPSGGSFVLDPGHPDRFLSPMEALLGALGACTGYDVVSIMEKKKQPLASYRIEVNGDRAAGHPMRYEKIILTHIGSGPDVKLAALERAVYLSHEKYCSVASSLNCTIETRVLVE
ncbi:OsmC family protein [Myxococcota bacterium]|nr:OsmC family protein [Myxococcota bacterium]MBU1412281.1 OsmC family protein [Myxococcota bacterium]MBU1510259.1 OsmC family protein [Myxococcota bacterium]